MKQKYFLFVIFVNVFTVLIPSEKRKDEFDDFSISNNSIAYEDSYFLEDLDRASSALIINDDSTNIVHRESVPEDNSTDKEKLKKLVLSKIPSYEDGNKNRKRKYFYNQIIILDDTAVQKFEEENKQIKRKIILKAVKKRESTTSSNLLKEYQSPHIITQDNQHIQNIIRQNPHIPPSDIVKICQILNRKNPFMAPEEAVRISFEKFCELNKK